MNTSSLNTLYITRTSSQNITWVYVIVIVIFALAILAPVIVPLINNIRIPKVKFDVKLSPLEEKPDVISLIREKNHELSSEQMLDYCKSVFVKVQTALMQNDSETLRRYETDELYAVHKIKIGNNTYGKADAPGSVSVQNAVFDDYSNDGKYEMVTVLIDATVSQMVGDVINGMRMETSQGRYKLSFIQQLINIVGASDGEITECPNCGATINFAKESKCPYCDSPVTKAADSESFKLSGLDNITPQSIIHI